MAEEKRGGRRVPNNPASYSGVGKNSRRTDGQPIRTPNVQDSTDLTQGDRAKLEAGQRIAPLGRTPQPQVSVNHRPQVSPELGPSGTTPLPQHLMEMPSTRPNEDVLTPASSPIDPDDDKEFVLQVLASAPWGNDAVRRMLSDLRAERAQGVAPLAPGIVPAVPSGQVSPEPQGPAEVQPEEPEAIPLIADEQPLPEEDVEDEFI